jgi:hypothetical protein
MQSDYEVSVNLQTATGTKDGRGGKTFAWATTVSGLTATLHNYNKTDQFRVEQAPGGMASGPGTMNQNLVLFKFLPPFENIQTNNRLVLAAAFVQNGKTVYASGTAFNVLFVREYFRTIQVDTEIVE